MLVTLSKFHFEISGIDTNDEHSLNILYISTTLLVFHLEISGKEINLEHPLKLIKINNETYMSYWLH